MRRHGQASSIALTVFEPDDEGYATVSPLGVPPNLEEAVRTAAAACPATRH